MSEAETSRRSLLQAALVAGGTFALGFELPGCAPSKLPLAAGGDFAPNAWIRITRTDRILFALDRVEMGQGTTTSHATLVAEELDVDPKRIEVVAAPAHRAYDNPDPQLGIQITGGSSSVRESFLPLRRAGATAREMLRRAGAQHFRVPVTECVARDGVVVHAPTGRTAKYGDLASIAATLPVPDDVPLKDAASFRFLGKKVDRLDTRAKVDGSAVYGIDVRLPGMLTAIVLRSPTLGGELVSFDATEAKKQPGVVDVVRVPSGVAIVASSYYRARAAEKYVHASWDSRKTTSTEALRKAYAERLERPADVVHAHGSVEAAAKNAKHVIEARYEAPYLPHATLEPQNATVHFHDGRCEIWAPTQAPGLTLEAAKRVTGLSQDKIVVHTTVIGGGFGRRLAQDYVVEALHVAERVRALGKPVKVVWSREDDFANDPYRPMSAHALRASIGADGKISGWFHRIASQSIVAQVVREWARALPPDAMPQVLKAALGRTAGALFATNAITDDSSHEGASDLSYADAIPAFRAEYAPVETPVPIGFWRGVGHSENCFVVESFVDELAHAAGKDPLAFRLEHLPVGSRHRAVLELAAAKAEWSKPLPSGIFRGIAHTKAFRSHCAQVAEIVMDGHSVRVKRVVAAVDCGFVVNPDIVRAQVEGAIAFGLSAALHQAVTLDHGRVVETNFHQQKVLRMHEMPVVEVHLVDSHEPPTGIGEPGLPPIAPAVANAIFAATGKRLRRMPLLAALKEVMP